MDITQLVTMIGMKKKRKDVFYCTDLAVGKFGTAWEDRMANGKNVRNTQKKGLVNSKRMTIIN